MDPVTVVVFVAGLLLGSLLNIVVIRLPRERNLSGWPRCTRCGRALAWWHMLPVLGWLAQAGRARCCGRALKPLFPLIELITGAVLAVFYTRYGLGAPFWYLSFVAAILIVPAASASAQDSGPIAPELTGLGTLHMPVTTSVPQAQRFFDQGLRLLYAFNHAEAIRAFREAARLDPGLAMAYWGWAIALGPENFANTKA